MASRQEGTTLGPYRILEQVGQGGMATVYKAYQPSMDRTIALKILPAHYAQDPKFIERFRREARTIARLEHQNILPVFDFGEESGITYLAMRYLEGGTLKDMLALGRLTLADAVEIMAQICAALDYAHRQGVVHRDVKPANIMVDSEGSAYLTDFGIAKVVEGIPGLTETGAAVGTPAYMAPEQSLGKPVDARTDIYALGVILYEMVVGRPPYQADTPMAVALAHIHEPLPLPRQIDPTLPEEIENVILKALAKNPDDRYQTASEMAASLKEAVAQAGVSSASSTVRALATQARDQVASQTLKVSPEMFAQAHPTARAAAAPAQRGLSPVAIGGIVVGVIAVVAAAIVLAKPGGAAATPTPLPYVYDSFDNPAYDGKFNPSLWFEDESDNCTFAQQDGALVLKDPGPDQDRMCRLLVGRPTDTTADEVGVVQARVKIASDHTGQYVENAVQIGIYTPIDRPWWIAGCGITVNENSVALRFYIQNQNPNAWQDRDERTFLAEADHWYTVQLMLDPVTMAVTCTVDGQVLGSAVPDNASSSGDQRFFKGIFAWRDRGAMATTYLDDFSILPSQSGLFPENGRESTLNTNHDKLKPALGSSQVAN